MEKSQVFDEWISILRRRFSLFAITASVGMSIAFIYALSLPRLFETTAVIQIEVPPVTDSLVPTRDVSRAMQQLQRAEQKLMARDHLAEIIADLNLFADLPSASMSDKIYLLRMATTIQQVTPAATQWRTDIAPTALTISVRIGDPDQAAQIANRFVASVLDSNRQQRENRVRETLSFFESEETRIGGEIARLDAELAAYKKSNAEALPEAADSIRLKLTALEQSDLVIEQQLIELRSGAGENRPVVANKIAQLEEQRGAITERRRALESSLTSGPRVEKTLNTLARRLSLLEEQYSVITRHRAEAEMGQMMEFSQQSENFEVLEMAQVPEQPIAPSRKKVFVLGAGASLFVAGLLVFLLESWKPVIRTASQLERLTGIRPVVSVPNVATRVDLTKRVFSRAILIAVVAVALPIVVVILNENVFPISSLF